MPSWGAESSKSLRAFMERLLTEVKSLKGDPRLYNCASWSKEMGFKVFHLVDAFVYSYAPVLSAFSFTVALVSPKWMWEKAFFGRFLRECGKLFCLV
ncbi:MAG: hypothetical protein RMJ15_10025 [Nitrososphaerota archaeon]|nr:hypothetical protein [Candidatus Bathyarchaeota archaeon]MDW8024051.1 hypothetical protein [Nitrososphaerota archaeon]